MRNQEININAGIEVLQSAINIINDEISRGKIKDDNMSYVINEWVKYFNIQYHILSIMNILPITSDNLTCIEYTKERIKNVINF